MSINDKLKQAIDKVDPDRFVAELKASVGELAREHGGKVESAMEKVGSTVDEKTNGKYADKLASARQKVNEGVAKVAAQPPVPPAPEDVRPSYRRTPDELARHDEAAPGETLPPTDEPS
jgi:hypothetical protein